jgi:hypothetical protein
MGNVIPPHLLIRESIMSKRYALSFLILAAVGTAAQADGGDVHVFAPAASSVSREAVRADVLAARAAGELFFGESGLQFEGTPSIRNRIEVRAELRVAQRLGLIAQGETVHAAATPEQERQIAAAGRDASLAAARTPVAG